MDTLIEKLLTTGGPLGVLVCVVWIFVRAGRDAAAEHRAWMDETIKNNQLWIERMHGEHILAREETRHCLDKNTAAMEQNTVAMREVAVTVARCGLPQRQT